MSRAGKEVGGCNQRGSVRTGEKVSVTRWRGGEYGPPRPGNNEEVSEARCVIIVPFHSFFSPILFQFYRMKVEVGHGGLAPGL